jgi:hypothetical protein
MQQLTLIAPTIRKPADISPIDLPIMISELNMIATERK